MLTNFTAWFMLIQMVTCLGGGLAFGFYNRDFWMGWIWVSYAQANIGFLMKALGH